MQLCHKRQIQVLLLHLLYEAQSAKDTHQIILFWYIEIAADHETLNISEFSTWSKLFAVHHDLISESSLSFFLHNLFEALSYPFSAAVQVTELRSISDVLVDQLHWMNSVVIQDLQILLDENNNLWNQYITIWQNEARQIIHEKWKQVKYLEWIIFNNKFFFYCCKNKLFHSHSDNSSLNLLNNEMSTVVNIEKDRSADHYWCLWEYSIELREKDMLWSSLIDDCSWLCLFDFLSLMSSYMVVRVKLCISHTLIYNTIMFIQFS